MATVESYPHPGWPAPLERVTAVFCFCFYFFHLLSPGPQEGKTDADSSPEKTDKINHNWGKKQKRVC